MRDSDINLFYERAAALASVTCQAKRMAGLLSELRDLIRPTNREDMLEQLDRLESELSRSQGVLSEPASTIDQIDQLG